MKTELRLMPHSVLPGENVIELWHNNVFVGIVAGADGPGVRVISRYIRNSADAIVIVADEPPAVEISLAP